MRRSSSQGFARAPCCGDESELAELPDLWLRGAGLQGTAKPADLVLALFKVLMEVFLGLKSRSLLPRSASKICCSRAAIRHDGTALAESVLRRHRPDDCTGFDGICLLLNLLAGSSSVEPLPSRRLHQDRPNNHGPRETGHGTPSRRCGWKRAAGTGGRVVEARLRSCWRSAGSERTVAIFPFTEEPSQPRRSHRAALRDHAPAVPPFVRSSRLCEAVASITTAEAFPP